MKVDYGVGVHDVCFAMKAAIASDMARHEPEYITNGLELTDEEKGLVRERE